MARRQESRIRAPGDNAPSGILCRISGFAEKHATLLVCATVLVALLLRVVALRQLVNTDYASFMMPDERVYHHWAKSMANGTFESHSVYEAAPLYAYVMAGIYRALGPHPLLMRILNVILGTATCVMLYLAVREVAARRMTAVAAAVLSAFYGPLILYSVVLLKTSLSVFLFSLTVLLFLRAMSKLSPRTTGVLGLIIGMLISVRANAGLLIPMLPVFLLWQAYRRSLARKTTAVLVGAYILGVLVAVSPFVIRNYCVSGRVAMTTSQAGRNLYFGNNPEDPAPYFRVASFASADPSEEGIHFAIEADRRTGRQMTPEEASSWWTREVASYAVRTPVLFWKKMLLKGAALLNCYEPGDQYDLAFMAEHAPVKVLRLPLAGYWLILPFGMAGMLFCLRRSPTILGLVAIFGLYAATLVVFFTTTRFRLPLVVPLIIFSSAGLEQWCLSLTARKRKPVLAYLALLVLFVVVELLPVPGRRDRTTQYNTHGFMLASQGRLEEAMDFWEESAAANGGFSYFARLHLAGRYAEKATPEDTRHAFDILDEIRDTSPGAWAKYTLLGDIHLHYGRLDEAAASYERSLQINAGQRRIRRELCRVYSSSDREKAAQHAETLSHIESFWLIRQ